MATRKLHPNNKHRNQDIMQDQENKEKKTRVRKPKSDAMQALIAFEQVKKLGEKLKKLSVKLEKEKGGLSEKLNRLHEKSEKLESKIAGVNSEISEITDGLSEGAKIELARLNDSL